MLNETGERFLKAILERVPAGRIVEIHLFPPIRSGQIETGVAVVAAEPAPALELPLHAGRIEVHTARYRLTRKGVERGKWEIEVKTQADAPLETVERVVRGVQERAGEAIEPRRLTGGELLALINEPAWLTSP
ncbi:MAG TPA: hypothetical protein VF368_05455 [Gemmatimonadaceae bacterium]|jgi:hypothetical protein